MKKIVEDKFNTYPVGIRQKIETIRALILEVAKENNLDTVEETLKWGQPSYLVKGGSTVRIDSIIKKPEHYALYFTCNTTLVETFREIYGELFNFEGNRAIVLHQDSSIHTTELKHCLELALKYHRVKHLPLLGA